LPSEIKLTAFLLNTVLLSLWFISLILSMIKIKCNIEKSGLVLIVSYSINTVLKTLIDVFRLEFDHKNDTNNPVHLKIMILVLRVADRIFLYILFSYVLVIRQIKIKIQS